MSPHRTATQTDSRQTGRGDTVRPALPDTSLGFRCQGRVTTEDHHNKRSLTFVRDDTFLIFVISSGARNLCFDLREKSVLDPSHSFGMTTGRPGAFRNSLQRAREKARGSNFKKFNSVESFPSQWRRLHDTNQKAPTTLSPHPEPIVVSRRSRTRKEKAETCRCAPRPPAGAHRS